MVANKAWMDDDDEKSVLVAYVKVSLRSVGRLSSNFPKQQQAAAPSAHSKQANRPDRTRAAASHPTHTVALIKENRKWWEKFVRHSWAHVSTSTQTTVHDRHVAAAGWDGYNIVLFYFLGWIIFHLRLPLVSWTGNSQPTTLSSSSSNSSFAIPRTEQKKRRIKCFVCVKPVVWFSHVLAKRTWFIYLVGCDLVRDWISKNKIYNNLNWMENVGGKSATCSVDRRTINFGACASQAFAFFIKPRCIEAFYYWTDKLGNNTLSMNQKRSWGRYSRRWKSCQHHLFVQFKI